MSNSVRYILVGLLFIALILVRAFQNVLFYDPFIAYFQNDYLHLPFPEFNTKKLVFFLFLRYLINTILSLAIIYLLFKVKFFIFSIKFYTYAFIIFLFLFFIALQFPKNYLFLFYVRRFLIQPLFVLVLVPAFYYQLKSTDFFR
ncbi:MAG: exosortase F system-associated protein [Flavobacteriaceae bacterium]|nr:exosortase F system-associated protein [Flavobacteriaceae bacterium]